MQSLIVAVLILAATGAYAGDLAGFTLGDAVERYPTCTLQEAIFANRAGEYVCSQAPEPLPGRWSYEVKAFSPGGLCRIFAERHGITTAVDGQALRDEVDAAAALVARLYGPGLKLNRYGYHNEASRPSQWMHDLKDETQRYEFAWIGTDHAPLKNTIASIKVIALARDDHTGVVMIVMDGTNGRCHAVDVLR